MENTVIVKDEKRLSSMALFWVCMLTTIGIGLLISYCSGIFGGVNNIEKSPFLVPNWVVIALFPVIYVHMGLALYFTLNENVYTQSGRNVRAWTWVFWLGLFAAISMMPYFLFHGMTVASYIVASLAGGLALGTTILMYQQSGAAGVTMTILLAVITVVMIYLGYWAFA
ncbi:MAG: tryptophan-rich sensory protein [Clostridiales bacterium]|nr:tryptophan-rich sensory protein [Clostridiales bacterium]